MIFVCNAGHLVRTDNCQISIDSQCKRCAGLVRRKVSATRAAAYIVHTSVDDGLCSARTSKDTEIAKAIAYERQHQKRKALITGLERELRRREKEKQ